MICISEIGIKINAINFLWGFLALFIDLKYCVENVMLYTNIVNFDVSTLFGVILSLILR